jgi:hypothetical protein
MERAAGKKRAERDETVCNGSAFGLVTTISAGESRPATWLGVKGSPVQNLSSRHMEIPR